MYLSYYLPQPLNHMLFTSKGLGGHYGLILKPPQRLSSKADFHVTELPQLNLPNLDVRFEPRNDCYYWGQNAT